MMPGAAGGSKAALAFSFVSKSMPPGVMWSLSCSSTGLGEVRVVQAQGREDDLVLQASAILSSLSNRRSASQRVVQKSMMRGLPARSFVNDDAVLSSSKMSAAGRRGRGEGGHGSGCASAVVTGRFYAPRVAEAAGMEESGAMSSASRRGCTSGTDLAFGFENALHDAGFLVVVAGSGPSGAGRPSAAPRSTEMAHAQAAQLGCSYPLGMGGSSSTGR